MSSTESSARQAPRLNQIVAVRPSIKSDFTKYITDQHRRLGTDALLNGQTRVYLPNNDEDFRYPDESQQVQVKAEEILRQVQVEWAKLFNLSAQLDWTNQVASADVVIVNGDSSFKLLEKVPVTHLMFLEKQANLIETMVRKLPVLDPKEKWEFDPNSDLQVSAPVFTSKTQKVRRTHVHYQATDKHPAQVEAYSEDVPIGKWSTTRQSGALPAVRVNKMLARVTALKQAIKFAREQANLTEVVSVKTGDAVFRYVFGD